MGRGWRGALVGAAIGLTGLLFALTPAYTTLETRVGLDALFHLRGVRPAPAEVVIVAIDGRTGGRLGLPDLPREWPRSIHGRLIDELSRRGAAAIVFDMDFRRPRDAREDQALADAIARAGRVVLFEHLNGRVQPIEDKDGRHQGLVWLEEVEPPLPAIAAAARGLAPFPLPKLEAAVDQFWTFKTSAQDAPTMPCVAFQLFAGDTYSDWMSALERAGAPGVAALPRRFAEIGDAGQLKAVMVGMRRMFEEDPALAERLASQPTATAGPRLAALGAMYGGNSQRYLNYYGPPGAITTVPYHALIKGGDPNLPAGALDLRGKAVFVGYSDLYDPGQPDRFYTVFTRDDGVDLSGVEIAATAFANLLRNESLVPPGTGATVAILAGFGLLMGVLVYLAPALYGVPLAIALAVAYAAAVQLAFNRSGHWWPLATPLLVQFPMALFVGLMSQYWYQRRRVRSISDAIRYYVPEEVSKNLVGDAPNPARVNRVTYGTCLATDMAGFSTIAERMKPGDLAAFLNAYFEALAQALKLHGVEVTEFRADAIMCAWTGRADDPAVRLRPALAALEASRAIDFFNASRGLPGSLRVGLADGDVYVGHAGGGGHFVYSIVGDCANTASRIEGLNKHLGTRILATRTVVDGVDDFLCRDLGCYRFVGKTEALPIAEIVALRKAASGPQIDLCQGFAEAMEPFMGGDYLRAAEGFENLLRRFPEDGPTRFLLARCKGHLAGELAADEPGIISMTAK